MSTLLFISSSVFWIAAYIYYFEDTRRSTIHPNRWSWLAFSLSILLETLTYNEISEDPIKSGLFFVSTICCIILTILIWSKAKWFKPDWTETFCIIASIIATILWLGFGESWWAHLLMLIAVPIAFIPTYRDAFRNWKNEYTSAWILWTCGDALAVLLVLVRFDKPEELPYAIIELLAHAAVWLVVLYGRRNSDEGHHNLNIVNTML